MADEDIQTILRLHSMNPDATPEEILEFTRFEVTPGTVKNIWKCGSIHRKNCSICIRSATVL